MPESQALNAREGAMIIIAGSGMLTGGRVLQHLKHRLGDERTTVLLPGFQAEGTRGRALQEGARELRIHGRLVPVRACRQPVADYSAEKDIQFFHDDPESWIATPPDSFCIFFPEDAHAPLVSSGNIRKVIIKIAST